MTTFTYTKPTVGGSEDTWGDTLNANWDAVAAFIGPLDSTELAVLDGITASTAELNLLDGVTVALADITATATEINYVDGVTSPIQAQIDNIPEPPELTQVQVEDDTSTVFGQVSGQRLGQAVAANVDIASELNATGAAPLYACRAWVNIEGSGAPTIRGSGNVSSITDLGVGKYRVNFTTDMQDVNYAVLGQNGNSDTAMTSCEAGFSNNVGFCYLYTLRESNGAKVYSDQLYAHVAVFR